MFAQHRHTGPVKSSQLYIHTRLDDINQSGVVLVTTVVYGLAKVCLQHCKISTLALCRGICISSDVLPPPVFVTSTFSLCQHTHSDASVGPTSCRFCGRVNPTVFIPALRCCLGPSCQVSDCVVLFSGVLHSGWLEATATIGSFVWVSVETTNKPALLLLNISLPYRVVWVFF